MLAYILALMIGSGSFALYMAAFFFPEVHRKNDLIWSGVGLFYALVLWVCAERITGGLLLGQTASVALLGWLGWQTFLLRRQVAPLDQQTPLPTANDVKASWVVLTSPEGRSQVTGQASRLVAQVKQGVQGAVAGVTSLKRSPTPTETYVPPNLEEFGTAGQDAIARFAKAAIPEEIQSVQTRVEDAICDTAQITVKNLADAKTTAETAVADGAESAQTMKKAIAPVAEQVAETAAESAKGLGGLFQGFNQKNQKKESKPVYVRKQFRDEAAAPPAKTSKKPAAPERPRKENKPTGKPVYVRKQFRDEIAPKAEAVEAAIAEAKDAISDRAAMPAPILPTREAISETTRETISETISETVVSDLLGNAPVEISAEEIVEDLLQDISAQEGTLTLKATEVIEVAIEPGDISINPITWVAELEDDTAIDFQSPPHTTDNSEHSHNSP